MNIFQQLFLSDLAKAKLLVNGPQGKSIETFHRLVKQKKINISDPWILSLYLERVIVKNSVTTIGFNIDRVINNGIPVEKIFNDHNTVNFIVNNVIRDLKDSAPFLPYIDTISLLEMLKKHNNNNNFSIAFGRISSEINIKEYGNNILRNHDGLNSPIPINPKDSDKMKRVINILSKMGFDPFENGVNIDLLFKGDNHLMIQENYDLVGLIDAKTVDQMYRYQFEVYKKWLTNMKQNPTSIPRVGILEKFNPSKENEMANYWREQSKLLGQDAMKFVMGSLQETARSRDVFVGYSSYPSLIDFNGLPTDALFDPNREGPLKGLTRFYQQSRWQEDYNYDMMDYFSNNVDRIGGNAKGFVKTWQNLGGHDDSSREKKQLFMEFATGYGGRSTFFDENGVTNELYQYGYWDRAGRTFLVQFDSDWYEQLSKREQACFSFLNKHPSLKIPVQELIGFDRENIEAYFDDKGPTVQLAENISNPFLVSAPELMRLLPLNRQHYLRYLEKTEFQADLYNLRESDIDSFFDDKGPTDRFYKYLLRKPSLFKTLTELDESVIQHFSKSELSYVSFLHRNIEYEYYISRVVDNSKKELIDLFDEKGPTKYFFWVATSINDYEEKISNLDANWMQHFSKSELKYLSLTKQNPNLRSYLMDILQYDLMAELEKVNQYFDENGIKKEFYRDVLKNKQGCFIIPKIDQNWMQQYSKIEVQHIQFIHQYPGLDSLIFELLGSQLENINGCFDESGPTPVFIKKIIDLGLNSENNDSYDNSVIKRNTIRLMIKHPSLLSIHQQQYLAYLEEKKATEYGEGFEVLSKLKSKDIDLCFDEKGVKSELWQVIFFQGDFDYIERQKKEVYEKMNLTEKQLKVIEAYRKIADRQLRFEFEKFVLEDYNQLSSDEIGDIPSLLNRVSQSNSNELQQHRSSLVRQLLHSNSPMESLNRIEDVFLKNNLPYVAKTFLVFDILHPEDKLRDHFSIGNSKTISPVLQSVPEGKVRSYIFSDLVKASFGSNNRSIRDYLISIERGQELSEKMRTGNLNIRTIRPEEREVLSVYVSHLNTLYNNTQLGKQKPRILSGNLEKDLNELMPLFSSSERHQLPDRIIRMFAYGAGVSTFEEAKTFMKQKVESADKRNREASGLKVQLRKGDFLKGIGDIYYLPNILQNGSVAREFLGESADSDRTPLDADISQIKSAFKNISDAIDNTVSNSYGPIWFVLKNDDRFSKTRGGPLDAEQAIDKRYETDKLEVFYTGTLGEEHYGIRTGFASSEIDYIVTSNYDSRIGLEIALNGFYIPVYDKMTEQLVFTPKQYDELRSKMAGLTYYDRKDYVVASTLVTPKIQEIISQIPENEAETKRKRDAITTTIRAAVSKVGLALKTNMDGDLTPGSVELIDTGSTSRGTNIPGAGDFDFLMRVDKKDFTNPSKMNEIRRVLLDALKAESGIFDLRLKDVAIPGILEPLMIDITFVEKTDKMVYSTESAIQDILSTIKQQTPDQYQEVIANILLAKKELSDAGAYKPNRGEKPQGGLGGVGVENWILQNGGSFLNAAVEFLERAQDKSFEEFQTSYQIWDFGQNHLAFKKGFYPHDNFVMNNMSEEGFENMKTALKKYVSDIQRMNFGENVNDDLEPLNR